MQKALSNYDTTATSYCTLQPETTDRQLVDPIIDDKAIEHFRMAVSHADTEENTMKALHGLYRATTFFVQSDKSIQPMTSQEAVMGRFKELMGSDNLERLKAMTQQGGH